MTLGKVVGDDGMNPTGDGRGRASAKVKSTEAQ